jgi:hypothetical protein
MSNNQNVLRLRAVGEQPVPCGVRVLCEAGLAGDTITIAEATVVDREHVRVQAAGERFVVLHTEWRCARGCVPVEEKDGRTGFDGLWDARCKRRRCGERDLAVLRVGEDEPRAEGNIVQGG